MDVSHALDVPGGAARPRAAGLPIYASILPVHSVVVLALPAVIAFDLAIPGQVFGHPAESERYTFTVCAPTTGLLPTTTGFSVAVECGLEALAKADTIVIPGYAPHGNPGQSVNDALRAASDSGARVMSICTGAFALGAAGLLDGRRATTHWQDAAEFAAGHPKVSVDPDALWVDEGSVLTSAGLAAGIDLCLHVVRRDYGTDAATRIARRMVVAPHRDGGQAQWITRPVPEAGTSLAPTCARALERLAEPLTVADLAADAGWAPRTFARRFVAETGHTPLRWLIAQRLLEGRRLLENTDLPVDEVATRIGFGTAANFRVHFARDTGTTPTSYRSAFRGSR